MFSLSIGLVNYAFDVHLILTEAELHVIDLYLAKFLAIGLIKDLSVLENCF